MAQTSYAPTTHSSEPTTATSGITSSSNSAIKDKRHFKKSMIFEYEKIESGTGVHHHGHMHHNDDSQSSSSCASFGGSPLMSRPQPQQHKPTLASRLDELRPAKFDMSTNATALNAEIRLSGPSLSSSSTLPSFNQQLNSLNTSKPSKSDGNL